MLNKLKIEKVVAVIRTSTEQRALKAIDACVEGGFKFIEVTFTIPNISNVLMEAMNKYKDNKEVFIGAGTVLNKEQAKICIGLNLDFIVAPNTNFEILDMCKKANITYIPGVMTVNEITNVMDKGLTLLKLFPANNYKPDIIKAFKAPLPNLEIMPTGGINLNNINDWLNAGAFCVGIGGNLIAPIEKDDYNGTVEMAKKYIRAIE